jgi:hypothetical protein
MWHCIGRGCDDEKEWPKRSRNFQELPLTNTRAMIMTEIQGLRKAA